MSATPTTTKQHPRLAVQAFWLTASKGIAAILNIGLPILLVRLMAQTEYGIFKEAFLFVSTATNIATFGVGMSAFYFMPRQPERGGQIALNILVYNFVAGWIPLAVMLAYPQILQKLFRTNQLEPLAVLLGFLVLVTLTSSLVQQIPTAMQDVKYSTLFIVGSQVARAVMIAAAALAFRSVKSIVIAAMVAQLLSIILLFWYLDERFPRFWTQFEWDFFKEQLAYALPYGAFGMLWVIQKDLDNYFVSATLGPKDYAIYAVGWVDVPLLTLALESIVSVMIVRISTLQKENRKKEIREVTASASSRVAAIEFPLFAMLMVGGKDLIVLFYTRTYQQSGSIFLVSILSAAAVGVADGSHRARLQRSPKLPVGRAAGGLRRPVLRAVAGDSSLGNVGRCRHGRRRAVSGAHRHLLQGRAHCRRGVERRSPLSRPVQGSRRIGRRRRGGLSRT